MEDKRESTSRPTSASNTTAAKRTFHGMSLASSILKLDSKKVWSTRYIRIFNANVAYYHYESDPIKEPSWIAEYASIASVNYIGESKKHFAFVITLNDGVEKTFGGAIKKDAQDMAQALAEDIQKYYESLKVVKEKKPGLALDTRVRALSNGNSDTRSPGSPSLVHSRQMLPVAIETATSPGGATDLPQSPRTAGRPKIGMEQLSNYSVGILRQSSMGGRQRSQSTSLNATPASPAGVRRISAENGTKLDSDAVKKAMSSNPPLLSFQ